MSTSNTWSEGYNAEINYATSFYREQSPSLQYYLLLLRGIAPPHSLNEKFNYFELGFGQGLTLTINALTHPQGTFWGNDFNSEQVNFAQQLAKSTHSTIHLYDDSFQDLLDRTFPPMDYISMHGIWSWISESNRQAILEFIRRNLKVGGVLHISYNALPGRSATAPLRQLLKYHEQTIGEMGYSLDQRARESLNFAKKIKAMGAGYFQHNQVLDKTLEQLDKHDIVYISHEYFGSHWKPMYFSEVASDLAKADLQYATSAHLLDHIPTLTLTAEMISILEDINDIHFRETVRDYMLNNSFRKDLFVRGAKQLSQQEADKLIGQLRFSLLTPPQKIKYQFTAGINNVTLQPQIYEPLVELLDKYPGAMTFNQLAAQTSKIKMSPSALKEALTVLASMDYIGIHGGQSPATENIQSFNQKAIKLAETTTKIPYLAAGHAGTAVQMDIVEQLALKSVAQGKAAPQTVQSIWTVLKSNNARLLKDGVILQTDQENITELESLVAKFYHEKLPRLQALGVAVKVD